jgi:hypothetical protein
MFQFRKTCSFVFVRVHVIVCNIQISGAFLPPLKLLRHSIPMGKQIIWTCQIGPIRRFILAACSQSDACWRIDSPGRIRGKFEAAGRAGRLFWKKSSKLKENMAFQDCLSVSKHCMKVITKEVFDSPKYS